MDRGLQGTLQKLERDIDRYIDAKITAMAEEATRVLEEAEGKLRYVAELKQRAKRFRQEFMRRYGLEGNDGVTEA